MLYTYLRLLPFTKAPKREKRDFSFWSFIYNSTFANINILNKTPQESCGGKTFNCLKFGFVL